MWPRVEPSRTSDCSMQRETALRGTYELHRARVHGECGEEHYQVLSQG